jgi:hypothetical protein
MWKNRGVSFSEPSRDVCSCICEVFALKKNGHSTVTALLSITDDIHGYLNPRLDRSLFVVLGAS